MRVGTWNLENLFLPGAPGGPADEAYEAKLHAIATTIASLDVDVLAVEEVGAPEALDELTKRLDGPWFAATADPDRRGIRVGFLARFEFDDLTQIRDYAPGIAPVVIDDQGGTLDKLSRPGLQATITTDGGPLQLIACHFKSKLLEFPHGFQPDDEDQRARYGTYALGRRAAEAATTRIVANQLLDGHGQDRAVIVLGDLNDTEYSATTSMLAGPGGSEIGTPGFDHPDRGDGARLWNTGLKIPSDQRFSRTYQGRAELIDHIFVSHKLLAGLGDVTTHDVGETSVGDDPHHNPPHPASDHRPVTAEITL